MKRIPTAGPARSGLTCLQRFGAGMLGLGLAAAPALAGGIDRSGQPIDLIFEEGNYVALAFSRTDPDVSGTDIRQRNGYLSGKGYHDAAGTFDLPGFGLKYDLTPRLSVIAMGGEDYGVDIAYPANPGSLLGGTFAKADSYDLTLIGRYHLDDGFSLHAGLRRQTAHGKIGLGGLAYGALSGYRVEMDDDTAYGYLVGAAYEKPEIALRVALTYFSAIEHSFDTHETVQGQSVGPSDDTKVKIPQAVNLDLQTGVAPGWLVFGQIRWVDHSQFTVDPEWFYARTHQGLVSLDDSVTWTIGAGHQFTDRLSASLAYVYDDVDGDSMVSPLAPTHGSQALRLGAKYVMGKVELSGGLRYTWLGNAKAQTADVARADFSDNTAVSVGMKVAYRF